VLEKLEPEKPSNSPIKEDEYSFLGNANGTYFSKEGSDLVFPGGWKRQWQEKGQG